MVMHIHLMILCAVMTLQPAQTQSSPPTADHCHTLSVNSSLSLQDAVITASLSVQSASRCVTIEIPSGNHFIREQTLFPAEVGEIEILGVGESVRVLCNYETQGLNYTWYFGGLYAVRIVGIQFESCPRPIRLDTIAEVQILDCSFRYPMLL